MGKNTKIENSLSKKVCNILKTFRNILFCVKNNDMRIWFILLLTLFANISVSTANNPAEFNRYLERAKKKMAEQNYTEALEALRKAAIKQPENPEIYNLMGNCNTKLKNFKESAKNYAYAKVLEAKSDNILIDGAMRFAKLF